MNYRGHDNIKGTIVADSLQEGCTQALKYVHRSQLRSRYVVVLVFMRCTVAQKKRKKLKKCTYKTDGTLTESK